MKRFEFVILKDKITLKTERQLVFASSFEEACERVSQILFAWNIDLDNLMEIREYA